MSLLEFFIDTHQRGSFVHRKQENTRDVRRKGRQPVIEKAAAGHVRNTSKLVEAL